MGEPESVDQPKNDATLFAQMKERLFSAVISDALDQVGVRDRVMRADLRPLDPKMVICGRAFTILSADVYEKNKDPYELEIEALDSLTPHSVAVWSTNGSKRTGVWGELLSTAARVRGAVGAIIDGYIRDAVQIMEMEFPVFCTGLKPVDSSGRSLVIDYNCAVEVGDVLVSPGDIVFADYDGVVVIPKDAEDEVIRLAIEKVQRENATREELLKGAYLKDVYAKYGVL